QLRHAAAYPAVLASDTASALSAFAAHGILPGQKVDALLQANLLTRHLQALLRLTVGEAFDEAAAPDGLLGLLAHSAGCASFAELKSRLAGLRKEVYDIYREEIEGPASGRADPGGSPEAAGL